MEKQLLQKLSNIESLLSKSDRPLTLDEASQYLNISKSFLYKLTSTNRITHYKPNGKRIYFQKSDLDKWLMRIPVRSIEQIEQDADDYIVNGRQS